MSNPNPKNQWTPGKSANPKGRPKKGQTYTDIIKKYGKQRVVEVEDPRTGEIKKISRKDAMIQQLWKLAIAENDLNAMKCILDRVDGKPMQQVQTEHSGTVTIVDDIG